MDYKVLYRKYRPKDFKDFIGQEFVVKTLKNAIINNKTAHAYIFSGPRGTGKTSMAKIFAKNLNCLDIKDGEACGKCAICNDADANPDVIEIDAASNNGVDEIREIINNIKLAPTSSKYKVYIIDEVHMLSTSAFNALLLTLEEPPSHVVFILATTDIQNVPITVLSRCQRFDFKSLTKDQLLSKLKKEVEQENINITYDALEEIAYMSAGGLRDAESILDQIVNEKDKEITIEDVISSFNTVSLRGIKEIVDSLEVNDVNKLINLMNEYSTSGINYKMFIERLINQLKLKAINIKLGKIKSRFDYMEIKDLILELNNSLLNVKMSVNPYIVIELIILSYLDDSLSIANKEKTENVIEMKTECLENIKEIEIKEVEKPNVELSVDEVSIDSEVPGESVVNDDELQKFINIRINNCFVEAKKDCLIELQDKWKIFVKEIKNVNKQLFGLVAESEIVTASKTHAVIIVKNESTASLINDLLDDLKKQFLDIVKKEILFIAIDENKWKKEKEEYIKNIKNNYEYKYKDEICFCEKESLTEIEKMAKNIFGEKLEIK